MPRLPYILLLIFGVFCCSTAIIFIRLSDVSPVLLAAYRLLIATALLSPLFWHAWQKHRATFAARELLKTTWPAGLLALHFISWIVGGRETAAANATLIVNMTPVALPVLLYFISHERVSSREWAGTGLAMTGVGLLVLGDYHFAPENVAGDLICFGSMLLYAAYLTFGRRHRGFPTIWHYVVPLYGMAGLLCLGAGLIFERPAVPRLSGEGILASSDGSIWLGLLAVLGLAVVPTVGGHSIINFSMKHLRGQLVGLINLFQFVFAGVMASFVFGELPPAAFFLACFLVISGAGLVILADRRAARPVEKPAAQANRTE